VPLTVRSGCFQQPFGLWAHGSSPRLTANACKEHAPSANAKTQRVWLKCSGKSGLWKVWGRTAVLALADLIEHPESRATPDTTWQAFVDRFDLPDLERQRLHAARRLLALFWTSRMWPGPHEPASQRFTAQVQRTAMLLQP
jgi:hypothetical protein